MRLPHAPALDGLRALAVAAVLLYHAGTSWLPGGFLGVEVFFVISGYLITSLLLAEWSATGRIDLSGFWLRRARRLLPALFLLLAVVIAYAACFLPDEVAGLRGDAVSGALYVNNWYQIFSHKSYFESVGRPSLLRHLWSLAVEEQFYLVWPILFCLLMQRPRLALSIIVTGGAAAACWMAVRYVPDTDPSRIYYGTDTRASGILLGAALAFLRMHAAGAAAREPAGRRQGAAPHLVNLAGLAALGVLLVCLLRLSEFQAFLYRGGFVVTGLATVALIAATVQAPGTMAGRIFAWAPLRWIGVRSYGIYLWHFPVFMVTRPQLDVPLDGVWLLATRLSLTVLMAALSYQLLELPIRQGAIARYWQAWRAAHGREQRWLGAGGVAAVTSVAALFLALGVLLFSAETPPPPAYLTDMQTANPTAELSDRAGPPAPPPLEAARAAPAPYLNAATNKCVTIQANAANTICGTQIVAIGDSVMLGVRDELLRVLGTNVIVDAAVGRQARHALAAVRKLREAGNMRPVVILHIGANGFVSAEMFDQIMAELADAREVLVVNVKVPRQWESPNNAMLAEAVTRYPKAVLVDWHNASMDRPDLFWKDGHHLRPKGAAFYADLLVQALRRRGTPANVAAL